MSRRPLIILRAAILTLSICSPLGAQSVGLGYQVARSNQSDMLESAGPGLRVRFRGHVELRYDYLMHEGQRVDSPCGGFIPPECGPEPITYSSHLHSLFVAARARLVSLGSFQLLVVPEIGLASGTVTKRSVATGFEGASGGGGGLGMGLALELSASRVGGSPIGGWIAGRVRGFTAVGPVAQDGYEPFRELDSIRSVEIGVTVAVR